MLAMLGAAAALLFAFDAALFRTGLYRRVIEPQSYTGQAELAMRQTGSGVLVLGDSRIAEGFSSERANSGGVSFLNAAVPGSTLRCWYYLLRELDPSASRFHAIVLPFDDYEDEDGAWDWADRVLDLRIVVLYLRFGDVWDFARSFPGGSERFEAARGSLLRGFVFKDDVRDFLSHPFSRIEKAEKWRESGVGWVNGYQGNPGVLPSSYRPQGRGMLPQNGRYASYRKLWLGRILKRYQGSAVRVFAIRVPRGPVPEDHPPGLLPSALREFQARELTVIDPKTFTPLEKPEYFFDDLHLNSQGRKMFSQMLQQVIR